MTSFTLLLALTGCVILSFLPTSLGNYPACFTKWPGKVSSCHVINEKIKPLVIAHRGNPTLYQENTLDGFRSVKKLGAHGFEVDVYLTKDNQLVCFHDLDTLKLTGVSGKIQKMTSTQIRRLRYKKKIRYGSKYFVYKKRRPIAFLKDVLSYAVKENLVVYIETKPESPILKTALEVQRSKLLGAAVAKMVKKFDALQLAIVNSYNLLQTYSAKKIANDIVIGSAYIMNFWHVPKPIPTYTAMKKQLMKFFPSLIPCLKTFPADKTFIQNLYLSGIMEKATGAAFTDIQLTMFDNPAYGTAHTMNTIKTNYSSTFKIGLYTAYEMDKTRAYHCKQDKKLTSAIKQGVDFILTDDVARLVQKIKKVRLESRISFSDEPMQRDDNFIHHDEGGDEGDEEHDEERDDEMSNITGDERR